MEDEVPSMYYEETRNPGPDSDEEEVVPFYVEDGTTNMRSTTWEE